MTIREIKYTPFTRKFKNPFQTSKNKFTEKTGFVISIITDEGNEYKGEVSLLFGFGNQTFEDIKKSLINLTAFKNKIEITDNLTQIEQTLEKLNISPGVRFGFEQALFSYLACETDISKILKKFFNRKPSNKINVNGLIGFDSTERSVETAQKLVESGFKTIKIKAGREDFKDDLKNIKTI
jgi:L-alanine-DL-glutamate epimerase-like enolase superfamily enzyme